jgi:hypothetical protein
MNNIIILLILFYYITLITAFQSEKLTTNNVYRDSSLPYIRLRTSYTPICNAYAEIEIELYNIPKSHIDNNNNNNLGIELSLWAKIYQDNNDENNNNNNIEYTNQGTYSNFLSDAQGIIIQVSNSTTHSGNYNIIIFSHIYRPNIDR